MGCIEYLSIFQNYGSQLRDILLTSADRPYPVFETRQAYEASNAHFKGILVWHSQQYYQSINLTTPATSNEFTNDVGFYVVPEFGQVNIIPNYEYKQLVVVTFDSNSEPDFDPFQARIIKFIDWFLNKHEDLIATLNGHYDLPSGTRLWASVTNISKPISSRSNYVRRAVTLTVRYCRCS